VLGGRGRLLLEAAMVLDHDVGEGGGEAPRRVLRQSRCSPAPGALCLARLRAKELGGDGEHGEILAEERRSRKRKDKDGSGRLEASRAITWWRWAHLSALVTVY
jgi:hypothetical protein